MVLRTWGRSLSLELWLAMLSREPMRFESLVVTSPNDQKLVARRGRDGRPNVLELHEHFARFEERYGDVDRDVLSNLENLTLRRSDHIHLDRDDSELDRLRAFIPRLLDRGVQLEALEIAAHYRPPVSARELLGL